MTSTQNKHYLFDNVIPYIEIIQDEDGYFAKVAELPGCMTQADTFAEIAEMLKDAMTLWIETALEDNETIPLPKTLADYSGKFMVRLPKSLHRELSLLAKQEGVSLNTLVTVTLGQATAQKKARPEKHLSFAA